MCGPPRPLRKVPCFRRFPRFSASSASTEGRSAVIHVPGMQPVSRQLRPRAWRRVSSSRTASAWTSTGQYAFCRRKSGLNSRTPISGVRVPFRISSGICRGSTDIRRKRFWTSCVGRRHGR